jgi:hypothetical protein
MCGYNIPFPSFFFCLSLFLALLSFHEFSVCQAKKSVRHKSLLLYIYLLCSPSNHPTSEEYQEVILAVRRLWQWRTLFSGMASLIRNYRKYWQNMRPLSQKRVICILYFTHILVQNLWTLHVIYSSLEILNFYFSWCIEIILQMRAVDFKETSHLILRASCDELFLWQLIKSAGVESKSRIYWACVCVAFRQRR